MEHTIRLETMICRIFARKLVRPANTLCRIEIMTWPSGALIKAP